MKKFLIFCCLMLTFTSTESHAKKAPNIGKSIGKALGSLGGKKSPIRQIVKTIIKFPTESKKIVGEMIKLTKDIMDTRKAAAKKITPQILIDLNSKMSKVVEDASKMSESLHNHPMVKEVELIVKMCTSPVVTMVAATPMGGGLGVVCGRINAVQAILGRFLDKADGLALGAVDGKENISSKLQAAAANDPAVAAAAAQASPADSA